MNTSANVRARTAPRLTVRHWIALGVLAAGAALAAVRPATAQEPLAAAAQDELASAEELRELVGPIALYPDDLVAIVLPASTYPLQIVQAARFLEERADDSSLKPNEEWDDSIVALLNYPEVLRLLNDDLDWTYDLGTAVLNQRADVLSAIQDFRDEAYAAGNLRSDERQTVDREDDTIEIKPADPKVIYVPYYEPERVVVYQPSPVYYYYPDPYPVYYYPYPAHHHFHSGFFWGVNTWFSIGWHSHLLHVYDPFYHAHPYYGSSYYNPFYVRNVYVNVHHHQRYPNYVWEPRNHYGGRPIVRGSEGRVYPADRAPRRGVLDANAAATRTREGSAYRTTEGAAARTRTTPSTGASNATPQPRRGVTSSTYRNRTAETSGSTRVAPAQQSSQPRAQPQARPPSAAAGNSEGNARPTNQGTYRSGGGMSQALERSRATALPSAPARPNPGVSPRAVERSTGMPHESSRAAPAPRESAPAVRAEPRHGGTSAQRSESGGGSQGNDGGGSYRGGGGSQRSHPATRGAAR